MASFYGVSFVFLYDYKPKNGSLQKAAVFIIMIDPLARNYLTVTVIAFLIAPLVSHLPFTLTATATL
jgi:hypothetical protein